MKTKELKIIDELRDLIPPLNKEEITNLHNSLETAGRANEPLIVWKEQGVLVDGHHRYAHCTKHNLDYTIHERSFPSLDVVKIWMLKNQLSRRNLNPKDASRLRAALYVTQKQNPLDNLKQNSPNRKNCGSVSTAKDIAKQTGVSEKTILNDVKFAKACDALVDMEKSGDITTDEKAAIMRKPKKTIQKAAADVDAAKKAAKPAPKVERKRRQPYEVVVEKFAELEFDQMQKAVEQIDKIYGNQ